MNSIQKELTGSILANEIRLLKELYPITLIVEGSDDSKLFAKFLNLAVCSICIGLGRENVLEALTELGPDYDAFAICDRDYAHLVGYPNYEGICLFTDNNDVECDIINTSALEALIVELGSEAKFTASGIEPNNLAPLIFSEAAKIGALRLLSKKFSWEMKFSNMTFQFTNRREYEICLRSTINHVISRSPNYCGPTREKIMMLAQKEISNWTSINLASGHDSVRVLCRAFARKLGSCAEYDSPDGSTHLARLIRVSFEKSIFAQTNICKGMRILEQKLGVDFLKIENAA